MCCEDIRIGRRLKGRMESVEVQTSSTLIVPAESTRGLLILFPTSANNVWVAPQNPAVTGEGILLANVTAPVIFTLKEHGDLCTRSWYGIADVAQDVNYYAGTYPANICEGVNP